MIDLLKQLCRQNGVSGAPGLDPSLRHLPPAGEILQPLEGIVHPDLSVKAAADGLVEGLPQLLLDDKDHPVKARQDGVVHRIVHDDLPLGAQGVDLLETAVAAAHPGSQHQKRGFFHKKRSS